MDGLNDRRPGTRKEKRIGIYETLNIAAWNVRSVGNMESELVEEIKSKGINITVISGNASMPEQVKRPNPWRKIMMMMMMVRQ